MDRWQYLMVLGACLLLTAPLEWLGTGVYRRTRRTLLAVAPVAAVFVVWDVVAIAAQVWSYNPRYVSGVELPAALPARGAAVFPGDPAVRAAHLRRCRWRTESARRLRDRAGRSS